MDNIDKPETYRAHRDRFVKIHHDGYEGDPKNWMSVRNYLDRLYQMAYDEGKAAGILQSDIDWKDKLQRMIENAD